MTDLPNKRGCLYEPYLEWELPSVDPSHDPYDVVASATFTHVESGAKRTSMAFFDGDGAWKVRFTGPALGEWRMSTSGPEGLDGHTARVTVEPNPNDPKGFLTTEGTRWVWGGTGEEHVPQLVMSRDPRAYWTGTGVDTGAIEGEIREFVTETGFTGFHKRGVGATWFDVERPPSDTRPVGSTPDPDAFRAMEAFLVRAYEAGASTHVWLWSSDLHQVGGQTRGGPDGVGGPASGAAYRLYRYIAARLGPIPGWSMGYGVDLGAWADAAELQAWYDFLKRHLGGWDHPLGGRADVHDSLDREADHGTHQGRVARNELRAAPESVFWTGGDYVGCYDYRVPYQWYRATLGFAADHDLPVLQEDRFRVRASDRWFPKDYTPALTRRGLWHSMMAGGVGNIWGNLLPESDAGGSRPYDNGARGTVQDVREFAVDCKDEIAVWHEFWHGEGRFRSDYRRANELTNNDPGPPIWGTSPTGGPISVALRGPRNRRYVFYREEASALEMDLRGMERPRPAVAVDAITGETTSLGTLDPDRYAPLELDATSDWAVAVGEFDG